MARKKKHEEHVNHERWLVSYADFMTLLFAFFVVMFSVSQVDSKKVGRFTESFKEAIEWSVLTGDGRGLLKGQPSTPGTASSLGQYSPVPNAPDYASEKEAIRKKLAKRALATPELAGLTLLEAHGELVLRLPERLMFAVGDATLQHDGTVALTAIAEELQGRAVRVRIEGHTDSAPIRTARYGSNWDLSAARAVSVVQFLIDSQRVEPDKLAAAGYGEYHPIAPNDTSEGRALNRRVDIVLIAELPEASGKGKK